MSSITVYPVAGANSPVDGRSDVDSVATWAGARGASNGNSASATGSDSEIVKAEASGGLFYIVRSIYCFDTSALTSGATISSAVLSIYGTATSFTNADGDSVVVVSATPATTANIVVGDFSQLGSTSFANISMASWNQSGYNDFTLDANGIANISKTGISKFGLRTARDLNNLTPTGKNAVSGYYADQAGTGNDPKLVVTYTTGIVYTLTASKGTFTLTGVASIIGRVFTMIASTGSYILSRISSLISKVSWTNQSKHTSSSSNQSKSTSAFTKQSKNYSTYTNQTKD